MITFTVFGSPVAQPRTKARAFTNKATGRTFAQVYNPKGGSVQWKADIKQEAIKWKPPTPYTGPVHLQIIFFFPRPGYMMSKKYTEQAMPHTKKPDRDNCEKAVLDALKGIFFVDDAQVCSGEVKKFYTEKSRGARAVISFAPMPAF